MYDDDESISKKKEKKQKSQAREERKLKNLAGSISKTPPAVVSVSVPGADAER